NGCRYLDGDIPVALSDSNSTLGTCTVVGSAPSTKNTRNPAATKTSSPRPIQSVIRPSLTESFPCSFDPEYSVGKNTSPMSPAAVSVASIPAVAHIKSRNRLGGAISFRAISSQHTQPFSPLLTH